MTLSNDLLEIKNALYAQGSDASEACFLGYLVWQKKYRFKKIDFHNAFAIQIEGGASYWVPFSDSEEDAAGAVRVLMEDRNLRFVRVTKKQRQFLEENFGDAFLFEAERGDFDYVYDIDSLCSLSGRKLSKKRNHINGFLSEYRDWRVCKIDSSNAADVLQFAEKWYEKKTGGDTEIGDESLAYEKDAVAEVLPCLSEIGADGLVLYVNGKIAAFTAGMRISGSVYDTVFEKADDEIKGSYNIINREFARYVKEKFPEVKYINREQDLNLAGLRQAKLSYMPCMLVEKFSASLNPEYCKFF